MGWQFWIDRGGTFTDLVAVSPQGKWIVRKFLSEQSDQSIDPAIRTIREILKIEEGSPIPYGLVKEVRLGTTVATNAFLEETGDPVLLLTNIGYADVLRIGDQHRSSLFSLKLESPPFLAREVLEIPGRIDSNGSEIEPLSFEFLNKSIILKNWLDLQHPCAIAMMHSYKNPSHEICLHNWLKKFGFKTVICSHAVAPLPRFIPRGKTALAEATISPILSKYLLKFRNDLGKSTKLSVMTSSGALFSPEHLYAKDTILSGPAGGMVGALAAARFTGYVDQQIVGFDMGGTSTDVFYVSSALGNRLPRDSEIELAGHRLMAERLPIHTVAAGGGSIIYLNNQRLHVGPRSAGANPGPACYQRGGPLTITDANLFLGRIQVNSFPKVFGPSFNQPIDPAITEKEFVQIAERLNTSPEKVAQGALLIAIERMSDAIKKVSLCSGHDIKDGILVAFGGAAGQHACQLAGELGVKKILLHPLGSVLSAYGIGVSRPTKFFTKYVSMPLDSKSLLALKDLLTEQHINSENYLKKSEGYSKLIDSSKSEFYAKIEIRHKSQDFGLKLIFDHSSEISSLMKSFEEEHFRKFGYIPEQDDNMVIERIDVEVFFPLLRKDQSIPQKLSSQVKSPDLVRVFLSDQGWTMIPCYNRENLTSNLFIQGPALIVEVNTTIFLESGWKATVDQFGSLILESDETYSKEIGIGSLSIKAIDQNPNSVKLELYRHRFSAIAVKMGERLRQTSRSVNIRERLDYSCAVFDQNGNLVANAPHIPVHLGSMGEAVVELLKEVENGRRRPLKSYETVITNDPFHGGTHLPDITAITPVFSGFNKPRFYVASRGHHADVGGLTPGSMPPFSRTINDEGLLLSNETFILDGKYDSFFWERRLKSSCYPPRNPSELLADLQAQVAANQLGVFELEDLVSREGYQEVNNYMAYLQTNAALAIRKLISTLNDSSFSVELDNGLILDLNISIDKIGNKVKLDFSKTSLQGCHNFHAPLAVTKAVILFAFRCLIEEEIPLNAGCFEPIELIVPKGCLLNPTPPSAVVAGNVETSQALANLIFGALGVAAANHGTMNNFTFGNKENQYYETIAGGGGAGNGFNGSDCLQTHMTNSRITDPEILEQRYPVRLELFSIRKGSGGEGLWHGGNGLLRKIRFLSPMKVSILSGSRRIKPFGIHGGCSGDIGINQLERIDGRQENLEGCASIDINPGEAISIATPGGGGYGEATSAR